MGNISHFCEFSRQNLHFFLNNPKKNLKIYYFRALLFRKWLYSMDNHKLFPKDGSLSIIKDIQSKGPDIMEGTPKFFTLIHAADAHFILCDLKDPASELF